MDTKPPSGQSPQVNGIDPVVVDPAKLPDLPPAQSPAWGRRADPRRWRLVGCSLAFVLLVVAVLVGYVGLRHKVWSSFDEVCNGLELRVLVNVPVEDKSRFEKNLRLFRDHVGESREPYALIGPFVNAGRESLADWGVDAEEVARLNVLMEELTCTSHQGSKRKAQDGVRFGDLER
ncbi:MAG: hypothetical protein K8R59_09400 [Thermoanaerobaculales bacterium]|nr:hypothetical protein [Thermoanaerobaculales bacterium]